jgi:predicted transcriptional regulator
MDAKNVNPLHTAKIVGSYLRHHTVGASQLPDLITSVHRSLTEARQPSPPEELLTPAVSVRQSVRHDYVVCLECGYRGKTLRRHITTRHGLSRDEYLRRWRLQADHLLTAPAYSERRSTLAKQLGLGRKPKAGGAAIRVAAASAVGKARRESKRIIPRRKPPFAPDRGPMLWMKQPLSRRRLGGGDRVLGLPRDKLSHSRRRPPTPDNEPNSATEGTELGLSPDPATMVEERKHLPRMGTLSRIHGLWLVSTGSGSPSTCVALGASGRLRIGASFHLPSRTPTSRRLARESHE